MSKVNLMSQPEGKLFTRLHAEPCRTRLLATDRVAPQSISGIPMSDAHIPCAWWHQPEPAIAPLDALRHTLKAMELGQAVPEPAARIMIPALLSYLEGRTTDLSAALGLRQPGVGRDAIPLGKKARRNRDLAVSRLVEMQPGNKNKQVKKAAVLLQALPDVSHVTDRLMSEHLSAMFREHGEKSILCERSVWRAIGND